MKVYFIRHGESEFNAKNLHQTADSELSEHGIKQAEFIAKRLSHIPIEVMISSPFKRARQTSEVIAQSLNKTITLSDLFVERKRPSQIENKHMRDPTVLEIKHQISKNYHDLEWRYSDEENFMDIKARATTAIEYLKQLNNEHIAVVTHGDFLKAMIAVMIFGADIMSSEDDKIRDFMTMGNTGLTLCEFNKNKWRLIFWNDQAHLGD